METFCKETLENLMAKWYIWTDRKTSIQQKVETQCHTGRVTFFTLKEIYFFPKTS